ncbi:MAG: glycoside hydrolase family 5 protein [Fibrobacter sp.]|nr:glycoside hydrolase family 5 protein [Fibrobacter sp.]
MFFSVAYSQNVLPPAQQIADKFTMGWNIGNTMEVPGDLTLWGNPMPTQRLIDSVKAAGFNLIRIPAAWDSYADQNTLKIRQGWLDTIKIVVDYCINNDMYVVLNSHWDGGWLEENLLPESQETVLRKQKVYWGQIAEFFKDYDEKLMFAGANEPGMQNFDENSFDSGVLEILKSYYQVFVDTVRATGGNNASRTLIIQGPRTDPELTTNIMSKSDFPTDIIADRLMLEVHFYPYQFTLMEEAASWGKPHYYWGEGNHSTTDKDHNPNWGEEAFVDQVFSNLNNKFSGVPMIIGEIGAIKRINLTGKDLELHLKSRAAFYKYVVKAGKQNNLTAVIWDTGYLGNHNMTVIDRNSGEIVDWQVVNAMREALDFTVVDPGEKNSRALKVLYSAKDSSFGQVDLGVINKDFSQYKSIEVRAYVNGERNYDSAGVEQYGFIDMNLVTMSDNWTWREGNLGEVAFDQWKNYTVELAEGEDQDGKLVPADAKNVDFFALQMYSHGFRGTIYLDYICFVKSDGTRDTLYDFSSASYPNGGNVEKLKVIDVVDVPSDKEWQSTTHKLFGENSVFTKSENLKKSSKISVQAGVLHGQIMAEAGVAHITVRNLSGKVLHQQNISLNSGANEFNIAMQTQGAVIVQIQQNSKVLLRQVISIFN